MMKVMMKIGLMNYVKRCPSIDEVIKAGVVPHFEEFLDRLDLPQLQVWPQAYSHSSSLQFIFVY